MLYDPSIENSPWQQSRHHQREPHFDNNLPPSFVSFNQLSTVKPGGLLDQTMHGLALVLAFAPLSPLLLLQGLKVRRDTPRLAPAAGPASGICGARSRLRPLRLVAVGESTVAGVGAASHEQALGGQVAARMAALTGRTVAWSAYGLSGASVSVAHQTLLPAITFEPADLLLVVFGVNDVLEHTRAARYAQQLQALIGALRKRVGNAPVLIAAAPPMASFPSLPRPLNSYLGARAALLNRAVRRISIERAAQVAPVLRIEPALFAGDGFHPSPAGYTVWAESLAHAALEHRFIDAASRAPAA